VPASLARAERQLEIKDCRILQLEQQLASMKAETEDLRSQLAKAEQKLVRYKLVEEEVLKVGRRVIP
jgi:multidrug resistance efflux pump